MPKAYCYKMPEDKAEYLRKTGRDEMKPKIATLKVFIELSDHSWIEKVRDADGKGTTCGSKGMERIIEETWLNIALNNLEGAIIWNRLNR